MEAEIKEWKDASIGNAFEANPLSKVTGSYIGII